MYAIIVKKKFKAAHSILLTNGTREPLHEHDWLCEVHAASNKLDDAGCVADFCVIEGAIEKVIMNIENKSINGVIEALNESATSELIARYFLDEVRALLDERLNSTVKKVVVWEDEFHGASYSKDDSHD